MFNNKYYIAINKLDKCLQFNKITNTLLFNKQIKWFKLQNIDLIYNSYNVNSFFKTKSWFSYKYNYIINVFNKKAKFNSPSKNALQLNYNLRLYKIIVKNSNLNFCHSLTLYRPYNFKTYLKYLNQTPALNTISFFKQNYLNSYISKWLIIFKTKNYKFTTLLNGPQTWKLEYIYKYKVLIYYNKLIFKQKLQILSKPLKKNYTKYYQTLEVFKFLNQIRFLWRSKFLINMFIIYFYMLTNKNLNINATILLDYLSIQFRVIFSKYEQKLLLYLVLNFNRLFIKFNSSIKLNNLNNLVLLQIIITGRWQRKRWVTPFPKLFISSPLQYNKLAKKIYKNNYYLSYKQSSIWTKKGNIGIRLFLLYYRK